MDHCVPASVAHWLRGRRINGRHSQVWTASEAHLEDVSDEILIVYADDQSAILVTTNRNCATVAVRMTSAAVVWLNVVEIDAVTAMSRAVEWLEANSLPQGRVLRVRKVASPQLMEPKRI